MNIVSRVTQQAANSLFSRIISVKTTEARTIHSLCSKLTFRTGENEQKSCIALLQPKLPIFHQFCGMKYKTRLRLRCKGCYFVSKDETLYVFCKLKPRHKQSQFKPKEENTWIWTSVCQKPKREW